MTRDTIPWWLSAVYKVGVPTAIACYLVWVLASNVQTMLKATNEAINSHIQQQEEHNKNEQKQLQLLRVICANAATSRDERNECFK